MDDEEKQLMQRALNLSYRYLGVRPRTIKEVSDYLHKKAKQKPRWYAFTEDVINRALDKLIELKLLDDEAFTEWFVRFRAVLKPKGAYALKQELKKLGVPQEVIDKQFETKPLDEEKLAREILQKRYLRFREVPFLKRQKKMQDFLLRRGFSYDTAKRAIAHLEKKEYNNN